MKKSKKTEEVSETDKQIKKQNKQIQGVLIVIGALAVIFLIGAFMIHSIRNFEYKGIQFKVVKEGELVLYNTFFELYSPITGKHVADYNIYLRNDPRELEEIPFNGEVDLNVPIKKMVIQSSDELNCEGKGVIAIANLVKTMELLQIQSIKDENATCDLLGRYMFVKIIPGEKNAIEKAGQCYVLEVKDCDILKVTERFLVDAMGSRR